MAGVRLGYVGHSILAALGVAAIIAASPVLFEALRWFGVAYLIYLAFQLVRSAARTGSLTLSAEPSRKQLRRGLLTALLDAKGMMIYFAILPQFMDHTRPVGLQALVLCAAKRMIVEVNENMPRVFGEGAQLHISEVDAIVENHVPLLELPSRAPTPEDEVIGRIIADMMPGGACLQMGVGALPNLVCTALRERNDLGIHTEALCSGLIDLIQAGAVTNRRKALDRGKTVFTFAMGQKAMYDFLDGNPAVESKPVDYVNDPRVIAQNDNVISINATLQIDLTGACNSEHMLGHQFSAFGEQLDFVRGA